MAAKSKQQQQPNAPVNFLPGHLPVPPSHNEHLGWDALRRLASTMGIVRLTLVGEARAYECALIGVQHKAGHKRIHLSQGPERKTDCAARLDYADERGNHWTVAGRLVEGTRSPVAFSTRRAPTLRPHRARRLVRGAQAAAAILTLPDSDALRISAPIVDLSARGLSIELSAPLPLSSTLTHIVLVSGRRELRRCDGTVTALQQVVRPDGKTRFRASVRLRAHVPDPTTAAREEALRIDDRKQVLQLIHAMADFERPIRLGTTAQGAWGTLRNTRRARNQLPTLEAWIQDPAALISLKTATLSCTLFGAVYELNVRVAPRGGMTFHLKPSPVVRQRSERSASRLSAGNLQGAGLFFDHPFDGHPQQGRLVDISDRGLAFETTSEPSHFWPDLPLPNLSVTLHGARLDVHGATVRSVSGQRVGVRIDDIDERSADQLRQALVDVCHAPIRLHRVQELPELLELHAAAGLLEEDMQLWLDSNRTEIETTWKRAHAREDGLMRTTVVEQKGELAASLTSVRAFERTWLLQHSAARPGTNETGAGHLHSLLMGLAAARPDGEYVVGFANAEARSVYRMVQAFMGESFAEHRGFEEFMLFAAPASGRASDSDGVSPGASRAPSNAPAGSEVVKLTRRSERLIENIARQCLDPVSRNALSLCEGDVYLPRTTADYRRLGLKRGRVVYAARNRGAYAGLLVQDYASAGLSLSGLMGAALYLPVAANGGQLAAAALTELCGAARTLTLPGLAGTRFVFAPAAADPTPLVAAGFEAIGACALFAFHRLSLEAYHRFVSNRYGVLQGRRRSRRQS